MPAAQLKDLLVKGFTACEREADRADRAEDQVEGLARFLQGLADSLPITMDNMAYWERYREGLTELLELLGVQLVPQADFHDSE